LTFKKEGGKRDVPFVNGKKEKPKKRLIDKKGRRRWSSQKISSFPRLQNN